MSKRCKVYGGLSLKGGKWVRTIVAATSIKAAALALNSTVSTVKEYWSVTGNKIECEVALKKPMTVFCATSDFGTDFSEMEK
jgi:hypothetical protein